jgi:2'-5' RNA ligase
MSGTVRAFVALEIPETVKQAVRTTRQRLQRELPKARWVRIDGQHLTLKFLGEVSHAVLDQLGDELRDGLHGGDRVSVTLRGSGFFPSSRRPRVAWIGGEAIGAQPVVQVVESAAAAVGMPRERRLWSLHLTQARLNKPWPPDAVHRYLQWGDELQLPPFECPEVVIFQSTLQPGGAVYTALERIHLG